MIMDMFIVMSGNEYGLYVDDLTSTIPVFTDLITADDKFESEKEEDPAVVIIYEVTPTGLVPVKTWINEDY
jgi:hypothetical protein